jgi:hypothetical protein
MCGVVQCSEALPPRDGVTKQPIKKFSCMNQVADRQSNQPLSLTTLRVLA